MSLHKVSQYLYCLTLSFIFLGFLCHMRMFLSTIYHHWYSALWCCFSPFVPCCHTELLLQVPWGRIVLQVSYSCSSDGIMLVIWIISNNACFNDVFYWLLFPMLPLLTCNSNQLLISINAIVSLIWSYSVTLVPLLFCIGIFIAVSMLSAEMNIILRYELSSCWLLKKRIIIMHDLITDIHNVLYIMHGPVLLAIDIVLMWL